jgi:hypothetical protein
VGVKASEILPEAPVRLTEPALRLADDLVAVHDDPDADPVVVPVATASARAPRQLGPVYRRVPGGDPVVPTGRVLVRFGPEESDRVAVLAAAGYRLVETLGYAPATVWARAERGDVSGSLSGLGRLASAPGVRSAEPELISERSWR